MFKSDSSTNSAQQKNVEIDDGSISHIFEDPTPIKSGYSDNYLKKTRNNRRN